jgi:glycosyltransferase involved in cell wall biosynthesis
VATLFPDAKLDIVGPAAETPREFLLDLSDDADVRDLSRFYRGGRSYAGSYDAALRGMIPGHLQHTVTFVGAEPYDRVMKRYAGASLLVNPSLSESFGMSLIEAQAAGTPVVATRAGGMPEIIDATGGGVIVDKNDPDALADAMVQLLSDREVRETMGQRGAQNIANLYSWQAIASRTSALHAQALSHRRSEAS